MAHEESGAIPRTSHQHLSGDRLRLGLSTVVNTQQFSTWLGATNLPVVEARFPALRPLDP